MILLLPLYLSFSSSFHIYSFRELSFSHLLWDELYFRSGERTGEQAKVFAFLEPTDTGDEGEYISI